MYNADDETTFDAWYKRYGPVIDSSDWSSTIRRTKAKPARRQDIDLPETIRNLTKLFGPKKTLIRTPTAEHRQANPKEEQPV
ncbi:hypothetical protein ANCCAN_20948 [Ancylostoma caninum]|uniref:Uncharacterized protein n=1 Tax=Ancylostoma caninum TaxID=29170 RepID=A0A368FM27_ANCCA|nr:hypothetical protein ANCCAN_20948 [Ancylostoma caninum]